MQSDCFTRKVASPYEPPSHPGFLPGRPPFRQTNDSTGAGACAQYISLKAKKNGHSLVRNCLFFSNSIFIKVCYPDGHGAFLIISLSSTSSSSTTTQPSGSGGGGASNARSG